MEARTRKAVPALEPSERALQAHRWALRLTGWAGRLALRGRQGGVQVIGQEHLLGGPKLILMNHSHVLDPLVLAFHAGRPLQFLITEPAMFERWPARVLSSLGQIPKRKLESETRSIRLLKKWTKLGGAVAIFPEGRFPWDGRLLPLQPGLTHLVHYLDIPVVTVRQINGDRFWPPWATHARRTRVRLEIDAPIRFEAGDKVEQLIARRLWVDPDSCQRYPVSGKNLAAGLARFLGLCPACAAAQALRDEGNQLRCTQCQARWSVGTDNRLRGAQGSMGITDALDRVFAQLGHAWSGAPTLASSGPVEVMDATGETWRDEAQGPLLLADNCLRVGDWTLNLAELLAHTLDWGNLMLLRTRRQRIALSMPHDSRALWTFAIDEALARMRSQTSASTARD